MASINQSYLNICSYGSQQYCAGGPPRENANILSGSHQWRCREPLSWRSGGRRRDVSTSGLDRSPLQAAGDYQPREVHAGLYPGGDSGAAIRRGSPSASGASPGNAVTAQPCLFCARCPQMGRHRRPRRCGHGPGRPPHHPDLSRKARMTREVRRRSGIDRPVGDWWLPRGDVPAPNGNNRWSPKRRILTYLKQTLTMLARSASWVAIILRDDKPVTWTTATQ
ncbi:hypothetical protein E9229_002166 [Paeniglutamicibacter cryotolerans]|uniref:Uncharacterized protein n=1 Tax=Paeniglutamicibacter cryotolerans TaxID=670079 RepID=A0A839QMY4_9MICC|nr:hypothetical protein [Paeniglutamicibacter cryotolerans]